MTSPINILTIMRTGRTEIGVTHLPHTSTLELTEYLRSLYLL